MEESAADNMKLDPQRQLKGLIFIVRNGQVYHGKSHFETSRRMTEPLASSFRFH